MPSHYEDDDLLRFEPVKATDVERLLDQTGPEYTRQTIANVKPPPPKEESPWWHGVALETGVGIAADFLTAPLLAAPIPGARPLYYGINYGVGYGTNVVAQRLRGETEINQGEAHAAGGFQTIPLGTTLKGAKGLRRAMYKGAGAGLVGRQVEVGIDEGRALTPREAITSAGAGAAFGGTFKGAIEGTGLLKNKLQKQIMSIDDGLVDEVLAAGDGVIYPPGSKEAYIQENYQAMAPRNRNPNQGELNLPDPNQPIFKGRFENVNELDRVEAALIQNRRGTVRGKGFQQFATESTEDMKSVYRAMASGELNAHHSNILKSGISLHEGRDEVESMLIETWLVQDGIYSGDNPLNNHNIPEQVHGLVHKWLNERVGKEYLTKLIGPVGSPLRRRWEQLPIDHPDVKSIVKQYAAYVNGATNRTAELMRAYNAIWGDVSKISEDSLDIIYKRLGINELEYDQLIKPGLSKKDSRFYNQAYGREKFRITWADGKNESIRERLYQEVSEDPKLLAQIDALHEPLPKVQDFSNEPDSPGERPLIFEERRRWQEELDYFYAERRKRRLSKAEKDNVKALEDLLYYGRKNPLFNILNKK